MTKAIRAASAAMMLLLLTAGCIKIDGCGSPTDARCDVVLLSLEGVAGSGHVFKITLQHPDGRQAEGVYEIFVDGLSRGSKQDRDDLNIELTIPAGGGPPTPTDHRVSGRRGECFTSDAHVVVPF